MSVTSLTKDTFNQHIQSGVSLVDFWAPWCGPCKMQLPIVDQLAEELAGKANIAKVNVDEQPELAAKFRIQSIPALLLFKNGELVDQMVGVNPKEVLKNRISRLMTN